MKTICLRGRLLIATAVACLSFGGCTEKAQRHSDTVTIAVEGDVDTFNPLFTEEIVSAHITELVFPRLVEPEFDSTRGLLSFSPLFASSWHFSDDRRDLTFHLRTDASWSDGVRVSAHDVQFTFVLYADTTVASVYQRVTENLRAFDGRRNISKSVEVLNDSTVVFHFEHATSGLLFDVGVPLLPKHILDRVPRSELRAHWFNKQPVTSGPFLLERYVPLQEVVLRENASRWCGIKPGVQRLVFKILPDYRTRVAQLESGEVDIVTGLRAEEAVALSSHPNVTVLSIAGRDYDFIGWNNIDPEVYRKSAGRVVKPHPLFGSKNVRKALTLAIDRDRIVHAYLGQYGRAAIGGVPPLFRWAYNDTLKPLPFDPEQAKRLLAGEGWRDADGDGILERAGRRFSFAMKLSSGNQLRSVVATRVQQHLREIGIEAKIEQVERATFWNDLMQRRYHAWIAGFRMPMLMQLDPWWHSDLKRSHFNLVGFRNKRVDEILAAASRLNQESDAAGLWKEFQMIVHEEQPYTFLFWINDLIAANKRVHGMRPGPFGVTYKAWNWYVATH